MFFFFAFSYQALQAEHIYIENAQSYEIKINSKNKYIFKFAKPTIFFWSTSQIEAYLLNDKVQVPLTNSYGGVSLKNYNNQALLVGSKAETEDTAIIYFIPEKQLTKCQVFESGIQAYSKSGVIPNTTYCGLFIPSSNEQPTLSFSGEIGYNTDYLFKFNPYRNSYAVYTGIFNANYYVYAPYHFFYFVTDESNEERKLEISLTYPSNSQVSQFHSPIRSTLVGRDYIIFERSSSESSDTSISPPPPPPTRQPPTDKPRSHTDKPIQYSESPVPHYSRSSRTPKTQTANYRANGTRNEEWNEYSINFDGDGLAIIIPFSILGLVAIAVYRYSRRQNRVNNNADIPPVEPLYELDDSVPPVVQNNRNGNDIPIVYN